MVAAFAHDVHLLGALAALCRAGRRVLEDATTLALARSIAPRHPVALLKS